MLVTVSHFRRSRPDGERSLAALVEMSEHERGVLLPEQVSSLLVDPSIISFTLTTTQTFERGMAKYSRKRKSRLKPILRRIHLKKEREISRYMKSSHLPVATDEEKSH